MIEKELRHLYFQEVQVFRYLSHSKYGVDTYATTPDVLPARIEGETREVITPTGSKQASTGRVFLTDVYPWLTERDNLKVQRPDGTFEWVELLNVDTFYDDMGPYYMTLSFGLRGQNG